VLAWKMDWNGGMDSGMDSNPYAGNPHARNLHHVLAMWLL